MNYFSSALIAFFACISSLSFSQTVIFSEDFEGASPAFQLNTTDVGSTTSGINKWIINNVYPGGNIDSECLGIPIPIPIVSTPTQSAGITGNANSKNLHMTTTLGIAMNPPVVNNHYLASDTLCNPVPENTFAKMTTDFSTAGFATINFSYYWICSPPEAFGEIYYSTNGGTSWTLVPGLPAISGTNTWTATTVSVPSLGNLPTVRFGFRFVSPTVSSGEDPAFGIDEIEISSPSVNTITTGTVSAGPYCPGQTVTVPFTVSGTFTGANTFTAQLSGAGGSFSSPVTIGSLSGTGNGSITATIPAGTAPGTTYRIRVVSSDPQVNGTENAIDIIVSGPPVASVANTSTASVCANGTATLNYGGDPGTVQWLSSPTGTGFTPIAGATSTTYTSGPLTATTYYQVQVTTPCGTTTSATWTVTLTTIVDIPLTYAPNSLNLCNGPVTVSVQGTFQNLVWSGSQTNVNSITVSSPGDVSVSGEDVGGCPAQSSTLTFIETTPVPLTISPASPAVLCGTSLNLTATSGFTGYTWSNQATGNPLAVNTTGMYSVSAIDANGCPSQSAETEVIGGNVIVLPITPANAAICNGQPVVLTAASGFSNYVWSNGAAGPSITVSASGFYSCTAQDAASGCAANSAIVEVVKSQSPIANFDYQQNNGGYTINFNNSSQNGETYQWQFEGLGSSPSEDASFTFPESGPYYITLHAENACGTDSVRKLIVVTPLGLTELINAFGLNIFPNPSDGNFQLEINTVSPEDFRIELIDITGRIVYQEAFKANGVVVRTIQAQQLSPGCYFLRLQNKENSGVLRLIRN